MKTKKLKQIKLIFGILGISLFIFLIAKIGLQRIIVDIQAVGWKILLLIPLALSWHLLNSMAWYLLLKNTNIKAPLSKIFIHKWVAESLNTSLPLGNMGGEAFRFLILSENIQKQSALSNVVHDRLIHYIGSFLFICIGSIYGIISIKEINLNTKYVLLIILVLLILSFFLLKFLLKKGLLKIKIPTIQVYLDAIFNDLFLTKNKIAIPAIALNFFARLLGTVEIYLVLIFLSSPLPFSTCLLYSSFLVLINLIFFIIPGGIGILEGGQVAFMAWLGMPAANGMSLAVIRRLRLMIVAALGLLLIPFVPAMKKKI